MNKRVGFGAGLVLGALGFVVILAGCSDNGPTAYVDTDPPAAPRSVRSITGDGRVTVQWVGNTESDLAGYRVYRGPGTNGPFIALGFTNASATNYVDVAVTNGQTYYYAVAAYDAAGNEGELSVENVFDTPRPAGTNVALGPAFGEPAGPDAGFRFADHLVMPSTDTSVDVYFDVVGGTRLMIARNTLTDVQDGGFNPLDALDWAPAASEGWSPTGTVELVLGHSYYVWTRDDHYAKFRVTSLSDASVHFDWAYQLDPGNPELLRHPRAEVELLSGSGGGVTR